MRQGKERRRAQRRLGGVNERATVLAAALRLSIRVAAWLRRLFRRGETRNMVNVAALNWPAPVSFGSDIFSPRMIATRPTAQVLTQIRDGEWLEPVSRLRALPSGSTEREATKVRLPWVTWAGQFSRRDSSHLVQHSGQVGIDLDGLTPKLAHRVKHQAVDDPHVLAAFFSASGTGVRLLFRCPPCSAFAHREVFAHVAEYVRSSYRVAVDGSGSDVARASFVSHDAALWFNGDARLLPGLRRVVDAAESVYTEVNLCVNQGLASGDVLTLAFGLGESRAAFELNDETRTLRTHHPLIRLALDLVLRFRRHDLLLTGSEVERAFTSWLAASKRNGRLRLNSQAYRKELTEAVRNVERAPWLPAVVDKWKRWTRLPEFPRDGTTEDKLRFAIERHVSESGSPKFFLSVRDAAAITGTSFMGAHKALGRLCRDGFLRRVGKRLHARHAQSYRLLDGSKNHRRQSPFLSESARVGH